MVHGREFDHLGGGRLPTRSRETGGDCEVALPIPRECSLNGLNRLNSGLHLGWEPHLRLGGPSRRKRAQLNLNNEDQSELTLVDRVVVVIAIPGVLAATAARLVNNFLTSPREQVYNADLATVQAAVNAYYRAPGNARFLDQRQFPIKAAGSSGELDTWSDTDSNTNLTPPPNAIKGTKGAEPP